MFVQLLWIHVVMYHNFALLEFFILVKQPTVCQGLLIYEVPRSHNYEPHSVGLLWMSDQLVAETSGNS
jgi:hypothetical protein